MTSPVQLRAAILRVLLATLPVVVAFTAQAGESVGYKNINNAQLQELMQQQVPLYDIRRQAEWARTGVIEGSRRLTFVDRQGRMEKDFLSRFTSQVAKDQPVIVMCHSGNRSQALARYLTKSLGYSKVYNVRDGIVSWIYEHKPVVNP